LAGLPTILSLDSFSWFLDRGRLPWRRVRRRLASIVVQRCLILSLLFQRSGILRLRLKPGAHAMIAQYSPAR
jgi:hypothetical protein